MYFRIDLRWSSRPSALSVEAWHAHVPGALARIALVRGASSMNLWGARDIQRRVEKLEWYHTIELGQGIVTPGSFDHRPYLAGLPDPAEVRWPARAGRGHL